MTISEASERYHIPMEILRQYESWGLCGAVKKVMGSWQYDDTDLENLSMIMTLHDIGFTAGETETYMKLLLEGSSADGRPLFRLAISAERPLSASFASPGRASSGSIRESTDSRPRPRPVGSRCTRQNTRTPS